MSEILNYKSSFVKRTREIINDGSKYFSDERFDGDSREVTFLLNCLLGLIVSVLEDDTVSKVMYGNFIDNDFKKYIPNKVAFIENTDMKNAFKEGGKFIALLDVEHKKVVIDVKIKKYEDLNSISKINFLKKIRNAIAHQHIDGVNKSGKWVGVKLWNELDIGRNFEIEFTIKELKKLAISISDDYIKHIS